MWPLLPEQREVMLGFLHEKIEIRGRLA